ncbi:MAG: TolC family protein [Ferrovum sp.]|nr:TolC family protein [Ferrovum sp.]NDU88140.1 TolC family protein [Ferrovum sp.]
MDILYRTRSFRARGWGLLGLLFPILSQATDLSAVWQAAQQHDLGYQAAAAGHQAGQTQKDQASALWHPTVQASGTAGRMSSQSQTQGAQFSAPGFFPATNNANFNTSINGGVLQRWSVSARQPLISGDRLAQGRELDLKAQMADLQWDSERQKLMLQTAQQYFEVVLASTALRVAQQQQQAVEQALAEVQQRYQVGDVPITDTQEALARRESIRAQVWAAQANLQVKQQALVNTTGMSLTDLNLAAPLRGALPDSGAAIDQWIADASTHNLQWQEKTLEVEISREEAKRYSVAAAPSVDLVGEVDSDHLTGNGDYGSASNTLRTSLVGIQVTIPLYTGGMRSAHQDEKTYLARQAQLSADQLQQQVVLNTREAWLGVTTGIQRVEALAHAVKATEDRLASTRLGQQVGDRSMLDLLNAQSDAASTRLAWLQARVAVLMDRLRLSALSGHLEDSDLQLVNQQLDLPESISPVVPPSLPPAKHP